MHRFILALCCKLYPTNVYWGDTNVHIDMFIDANSWGRNKKLMIDDTFRFAKDEAHTEHNAMRVRLYTHYDVLVVADHASQIGLLSGLYAKAGIAWARERLLCIGYWVLGIGYWVLGIGYWGATFTYEIIDSNLCCCTCTCTCG